MSTYKDEVTNLKDLKKYLTSNSQLIDEANKERKVIRTQQHEIDKKFTALEQEQKQISQGREFLTERVVKLESELEDFDQEQQGNTKKLAKLENEKKKFALAKKFKDAGKCQQELKEVTARQEFLET